jgi:hypothetical protein
VIQGVELDQYAGVLAAESEGLAIGDALAQEGLSDVDWRAVDVTFKEKLASDAQLFQRFTELHTRAVETLSRRVSPLDDDPAAWAGFVAALARAGEARGLLERHRLGENDLLRLTRSWGERLSRDKQLERKVTELSASAACPDRIDADPPALRPFPWTKGQRGGAASSGAEAAIEGEDFGDVERDVDLFAALSAGLLHLPEQREALLELARLDEADLERVHASWKDRIARDPDVRAQYLVAFAEHRASLRAAPPEPSAQLDLDLYAALCVALERTPDQAGWLLAECGLDPAAHAALVAAWEARFDADPSQRLRFVASMAKYAREYERMLSQADREEHRNG